jgi:hypothetical protein
MAKHSEQAKLEEVKAILNQLQRIRPDLADDAAAGTTPFPLKTFAQSSEAPGETPSSPKRFAAGGMTKIGLALGLLITLAGGAFLIFGHNNENHQVEVSQTQAPDHTAALPTGQSGADTPSQTLSKLYQAQQLMAGGDIVAARKMLEPEAEGGSPDAALTLARSYDPNFLRSIDNANSSADARQAEFWYRRWHDIAVKEGLVSDSLRLERLIRSIQ